MEAIKRGAATTTVLNVLGATIPEEVDIFISDLLNDEELPYDLPSGVPEKPEFVMEDEFLLIRALPKLNCKPFTSLIEQLEFTYPHRIPIVQPNFGSLSYAMYHYDGTIQESATLLIRFMRICIRLSI